VSFSHHIDSLVATLPKFPSLVSSLMLKASGLVLHTPSTPYASILGSELLWFDDNFEIYYFF